MGSGGCWAWLGIWRGSAPHKFELFVLPSIPPALDLTSSSAYLRRSSSSPSSSPISLSRSLPPRHFHAGPLSSIRLQARGGGGGERVSRRTSSLMQKAFPGYYPDSAVQKLSSAFGPPHTTDDDSPGYITLASTLASLGPPLCTG